MKPNLIKSLATRTWHLDCFNEGDFLHGLDEIFMPPRTHAKAPADVEPSGRGKGRILVVDNEPDIRELVTLTLEAEGFEIVTAASGEAAIETANHSAFDLAILDVAMDGLDGVDVAVRLRKDHETSAMKIVFHTGVAEGEITPRFADYDAYLQKPVEPLDLLNGVRRVVDGE